MSVMPTVGVSLPVYPLVTGPLLHALEHASSVTQSASDEEWEIFMLFAEVVVAAAVPNESIVVIPLTKPGNDEVMDFAYLARSQVMFVPLRTSSKNSDYAVTGNGNKRIKREFRIEKGRKRRKTYKNRVLLKSDASTVGNEHTTVRCHTN
jgi:hypothetical protein